MAVGDLFDTYSRQARLQPALFSLFPLFLTVAVWLPALYELFAGLLGFAVACGVTVLLAHIARVRGRSAEAQLFNEWGGKPTTIWLRHRSDQLDPRTKSRYFVFFEKKILEWERPSMEEETADPMEADQRYDTAVRWLLEYTRERKRFPLVFKENVSYGFRRNLFGLKTISLIVGSACIVANCIALYRNFAPFHVAGASALVVSIATVVVWGVIVKSPWVRDAADAYAKALLASCDAQPLS